MERLAERHFKKQDGFYMKCSEYCRKEVFSCEDCEESDKLVDRLGEIENILGDDYDLDRLRELVEADRDGRCVVFSKEENLKNGDRVWYVDKENGELESGTVFLASYKDGKLDSFSVDFDCGDFDEFLGSAWGDCFFGSKEAAEQALKNHGGTT